MGEVAGPAEAAGLAEAATAHAGPAASVGANARVIAGLTMAARVAGLARMLVFAACVGASAVGAAYQSANTVPNVIFEIAAGGVLAAIVVPLLAARVQAGDCPGVDAIASALLTWTLLVLLPLTVLVAVGAPKLAGALLPEPDTARLGTHMLWVFAPQVVLYGLGIVVTGILHAHRRFVAAALAPLISSLVVIATYGLYAALVRGGMDRDSAVWVLAGGTTAGVVALVGTLVPSARHTGLHLRPTLRFPDGVAARARRLAGAGLIALLAQQISVLAVLWLTNHRAATGSINAYQYVQAIYLLPYAVLAVPLATAAYPVLGASDGQGEAAEHLLAQTGRRIVILAGMAATVLAVAAADLGTFFTAIDAGRTGGGASALAALPQTMRAFAPGLIGFGLSALLTRALYVRGSATRGSLAMAAGWLLAALLPLAAAGSAPATQRTLSLLGIGSSIGMTLAALLLLWLVRGSWGSTAVAGVTRATLAAGAAALVASAVAPALRSALPAATSAPAAVAWGVLLGMAAGAAYLLWVGVTDPGSLRLLMRGRGRSAIPDRPRRRS